MSHRRVAVVLSVIALVSLSAVPAMSQSGRSASAQWAPPRTADGQPDLQGVWANNSATPLQRPAALAGKKVISDEELAELNQRIAEIREARQIASQGVVLHRAKIWRRQIRLGSKSQL